MHLLDQLERPVIFAHRGASAGAPENTISAFNLAVTLGAKAIELDTMLSKDGIPVVIHDHTLERTTNGHGPVSGLNCSDLTHLDAGSWFSNAFRGEKIPLLREILNRFTNNILVNIELKNYHAPYDNLTETVLQMVDELNLWDSVLFSSFLPRNLKLIRTRKPEAKIALLCPSGIKGFIFRSTFYFNLSPEYIHPAAEDVDSKYIKREHNRGRKVNVWTVNNTTLARDLFMNEVDGIFSDDPASMLEVLRLIHPPVA